MSRQVIHADFIALRPDVSRASRGALLEAAAALRAVSGVVSVIVIDADTAGDFDLALLFVLQDFAALEPFGTDPAYARFLQGSVAPLLRAFAGADVELIEDSGPILPQAACLALAAPPETYDWEVRSLLEDWAREALGGSPGSRHLGLAAGERQRYRGIVVVSSMVRIPVLPPIPSRFTASMIQGAATVLA